jgi:urea transport system ATP-binding protein
MLTVQGLSVSYGESRILWDVHLHVPQGQVVCLMGRNGVGKSTLLKSIMGLFRARTGSILFDGQDLAALSPEERARQGIGYAPQGREIFPSLTVLENLLVGLVARGQRNGSIPEEVFRLFPVLKTMLTRKGGVLSGGQQQQLAIARALVTRPRLLLLDEPTEGIQPSIILEIEEVVRRIREEGKISVLLVEQYLEFAKRLADSYAIMEKGSIVSEGTMRELREDVVKRYLTV